MKKQLLVVTVPVANLRKEPVGRSSEYICDDLQETQLLCNEYLFCNDETEDWYYVEAVEQKKVNSQGDWQGYPGWIRKTSARFIDTWPELNAVVKRSQTIILKTPPKKAESLLALSIGTRLAIENRESDNYHKTTLSSGQQGWIKKDDVNIATPVMDVKPSRSNIIETARTLLGMPYLWGGRSACTQNWGQGSGVRGRQAEQGTSREDGRRKMEAEALSLNLSPSAFHLPPHAAEDTVRGVDCSSLTNLAYRVNWIDIPRDAHDQWRVSTEIGYDALAPADLIFVSAEDAHDRITHVMMYLAGEEFIEALETGSVVTINTFKNKFGLTLRKASQQDFIVNKRKISFGSILIAGGEK